MKKVIEGIKNLFRDKISYKIKCCSKKEEPKAEKKFEEKKQ